MSRKLFGVVRSSSSWRRRTMKRDSASAMAAQRDAVRRIGSTHADRASNSSEGLVMRLWRAGGDYSGLHWRCRFHCSGGTAGRRASARGGEKCNDHVWGEPASRARSGVAVIASDHSSARMPYCRTVWSKPACTQQPPSAQARKEQFGIRLLRKRTRGQPHALHGRHARLGDARVGR